MFPFFWLIVTMIYNYLFEYIDMHIFALYSRLVFLKTSVFVLFTDNTESAKCDELPHQREEGLPKANSLWFPVIKWLKVAHNGII